MYPCGSHLPETAALASAGDTLLPPVSLAACPCVFQLALSTVIRAVRTIMLLSL
jgi:hypothetical protein